jgi:hypothetical protein
MFIDVSPGMRAGFAVDSGVAGRSWMPPVVCCLLEPNPCRRETAYIGDPSLRLRSVFRFPVAMPVKGGTAAVHA